jgi:sialate O-acetylesterase
VNLYDQEKNFVIRTSLLIRLLIFSIATYQTSEALSEVALPSIFSDHMVLQRDQPIPVWGTASAGEQVSVTLGNETRSTIADQNGRWRVRLDPKSASDKPVSMILVGSNSMTIKDILIGEVWLCSGQSNMHWPLKQATQGAESIAKANLPNLRLLNMRGNPYGNGREFSDIEIANCTPEKYLTGKWAVSSPQSATDFSAVAMFFGLELLEKQKVPIGLIHNAIGGTPTEAWISRKSLGADPILKPLTENNWFKNELVHQFCRDRAALNLKRKLIDPKVNPASLQHPYQPGFMYESGIAPIATYSMRGVIWYQGESNAHNPGLHDRLFQALIADWRSAWKQGNFPFLYVQLPNIATANWAEFRESQRRALQIPNTGMAVTIDIGEPADVHPPEKHEVGHRLALIARAKVYGEKIEYSGPTLQSIEAEGDSLRLRFVHCSGGLKTTDNKALTGFEVAGKDRVFIPATAIIKGSEVVVRGASVVKPVAIRYAFAANPDCNLRNQANLPASPFIEEVK